MSQLGGYYRWPAIFNNQIIFVSEDDLWTVPSSGGIARRLTAGLGSVSHPLFSPDGKLIVLSSAEEGHREIYLIDSQGGNLRRLTYLGENTYPVSWKNSKTLIISTDAYSPFKVGELAEISLEGGEAKPLQLGPATSLVSHQDGTVVIERASRRSDPSWWKRYRGGTAGQFFIAPQLEGEFSPFLKDLKSNLFRPFWIGDRIFFISDHEGVGNIYSSDKTGKNIKPVTTSKKYYVRNPSTDGQNIVYHSGADLYLLNVKSMESKIVKIEYFSQQVQRQRKFVEPTRFVETTALNHTGSKTVMTVRGQIAAFANWVGPVNWLQTKIAVRFRLGQFMNRDESLVCISDDGGDEKLITSNLKTGKSESLSIEFGRATQMKAAPTGNYIAISNHKNELHLINSELKSQKVVAHDQFGPMLDFNWSADGRYLAYSLSENAQKSAVYIFDCQTEQSRKITRSVLKDFSPSFDPDGKFLYLISTRDLNPVYDSLQFELAFPESQQLCLVTLQKTTTDPFLGQIQELEPSAENSTRPEDEKSKLKLPTKFEIDYDGIADRLLAFPIPGGTYLSVHGIKDKALYVSLPMEKTLAANWLASEPPAKGTLHCFDFKTLKSEVLATGVSYFSLSADRSQILVRRGFQHFVWKAGEKEPTGIPAGEFSEKSGRLDLSRLKLMVEPVGEWTQMFAEAWRLQRDHFWRENMSNIKWEKVFERYSPLIDRVGSRSEFSDLVWEMQGELGTSHAYDMLGDFRKEPHFTIGQLGAQLSWNNNHQAYEITKLYRGDSWNPEQANPLMQAGVTATEGQLIHSIAGKKLTAQFGPRQALMNLAGHEVEVGISGSTATEVRKVRLKTLAQESSLRYRDWVEHNLAYVHKKSNGRVGYVHIPNMSAVGFSEFHRYYLQEFDHDSLIIDVRYNGGGHVSALLLEKLARKRIGFDQTRWFGKSPYPGESPAGPLVALTNEFAGSDGDMFSHAFKLMKLGPLLGKRTWGGVIGIWPRHHLVDGGITTQPEFSFWFEDVGWNIENFGTLPDIEIENFPHHFRNKIDYQLDRGIEKAVALMEKQPRREWKVTEYPDLGFDLV